MDGVASRKGKKRSCFYLDAPGDDDNNDKLRVPLSRIVIEAEASLVAKVKELDLSRNPVTKIQGAEKLTNCVKLDGNICSLKSVPTGIEEMKALQTLNLSSNQITEIPSSFGELKALQTLDLSKNQITEIPFLIGEIKVLQIIYLTK